MIIDFSLEHCVVGEKFEGGSWRYVGGHVIYIEKEDNTVHTAKLRHLVT